MGDIHDIVTVQFFSENGFCRPSNCDDVLGSREIYLIFQYGDVFLQIDIAAPDPFDYVGRIHIDLVFDHIGDVRSPVRSVLESVS